MLKKSIWHLGIMGHQSNFQYQFLQRTLPTNLFLTKIGNIQDPKCPFCRNAPYNLTHFFWYCPKVNLFRKVLTYKLLVCELIPQDYLKNIAVFGPKARHIKVCHSTELFFLLIPSLTLPATDSLIKVDFKGYSIFQDIISLPYFLKLILNIFVILNIWGVKPE